MSHTGFIELMPVGDLAEGTMVQAEAEDHKLLVAHVDGEFYVADAHCPHLHANLTKGALEGTVVVCPLHHSRFDLRDGSVLDWTNWSGAAKSMAEFVRHPRPLRVYETEVRDGVLWVGPQKEPPAGA